MANKKITDLQLRSDFDETCNVPVDDSTQTKRVTGEQIKDFMIEAITTPTIQTFTSGSGTYTKPADVKWIRVRMVGGGGGGSGSGAIGVNIGTDGGQSEFSSADHTLECTGGGGGTMGGGGNNGGPGGLGSFSGTGAVGFGITGNGGHTGIYQGTGSLNVGYAAGGCSPFGGNGHAAGAAQSAKANSGSGGASGGISSVSAGYEGGGGGAGGYLDVIIKNPSASYAYVVGGQGLGGAGGSSGENGGDAGTGFIVVEEFYI